MRIGVYGGSFNPPHVVHAMVASWLLWTDQVDQVWIVPVFRHAFEGIHDKKLAAFQVRVQWCNILTSEVDSRILVSSIESKLPTPSYSIDTLQALAKQHSDHDFRLCIGSDVIPDLPKWKNWEIIENRFSPIIVGRVGYDNPKGSVSFPPVSSTKIRQHLTDAIIPEDLLLHGVSKLLKQHNPYLS